VQAFQTTTWRFYLATGLPGCTEAGRDEWKGPYSYDPDKGFFEIRADSIMGSVIPNPALPAMANLSGSSSESE
jgi:hypothetical protein